jgi:hypothetical protein
LQGDIPKFGSPERFGAFSLNAISKVWSWKSFSSAIKLFYPETGSTDIARGKTVIIRSAHRVILLAHSSKWATRPAQDCIAVGDRHPMLFTAIVETECDNRIFIKSARLFAAERVD